MFFNSLLIVALTLIELVKYNVYVNKTHVYLIKKHVIAVYSNFYHRTEINIIISMTEIR